MLAYRSVTPDDAPAFWTMLNALDRETDHMMYEPGERASRTDPAGLADNLRRTLDGGDFLWVAEADGDIVGFLHAARGAFRRNLHTAHVVVGIRAAWRHQGAGTALFAALEDWARENGVVRLELTVESANAAARSLYEKRGFVIEGLRAKAMRVNGEFVDEYYMARLLPGGEET